MEMVDVFLTKIEFQLMIELYETHFNFKKLAHHTIISFMISVLYKVMSSNKYLQCSNVRTGVGFMELF